MAIIYSNTGLVGKDYPSYRQADGGFSLRFQDLESMQSSEFARFGAGTLWQTPELQYEEAPIGAVDFDLTTAAGVTLYEIGYKFTSRAIFVKALQRGAVYRDGDSVQAGRDRYEFVSSSYVAGPSDLPGFRPHQSEITPDHFGADPTGSVVSTAAVQEWANYIVANRQTAQLSTATYLIDAPIVFPNAPNWGIVGAGSFLTIFKQQTDNVKVFDLGGASGPALHSFRIEGIGLDYTNTQPAENTGARALYFSTMAYQGIIRDVIFLKGYYGITVKSGVGGPWGQTWDDLRFTSGLTGGAMDWSGVVNAVPNNQWGRFLVEAGNMTQTLFKGIKGYNWTINAIEILHARNVGWFSFQSGSVAEIQTIKCELAHYDSVGVTLLQVPSCSLRIGSLSISGTTCVLASTGNSVIFNGPGGGRETISVRALIIDPTQPVQNFYIGGNNVEIDHYQRSDSYPVRYTKIGSTAACETFLMKQDITGRISSNNGDADVTWNPGDPNYIMFETPLTTSRKVSLSTHECDLFNGLWYQVCAPDGSSQPIEFSCEANVVATLQPGETWMKLVYRRYATGYPGWTVVGRG